MRNLRYLLAAIALTACLARGAVPSAEHPECDRDDGGVTLPAGFCAAVYTETAGTARHLAVGPDGIVYVALDASGRKRGGILISKDTTGDGRSDVQVVVPTDGGSGIALHGGWLYFSTVTTVLRFRLAPGGMGVEGPPETIVQFMPAGGHSSRSLAFDDSGGLFVHVGSDSNVCTETRRGPDPCPELPTRAGIWRYQADKTNQNHPADGERWATGLRNSVGLAWDSSTTTLYAVSHGRDALASLWPKLYTTAQSAEQPSEEFVAVQKGDDFGWPYCFHDNSLGKKVLAPEYGGDGKTVGRCGSARDPVLGFPGHWGPDGLLLYRGTMLPERYRGGAFIAFHGSWNRAPMPQAGYKVVFAPRANGRFGPDYETFADGFAGGHLDPGSARYRPVGVAEGPDGSLYVTDDQRGRVWRIVYTGAR